MLSRPLKVRKYIQLSCNTFDWLTLFSHCKACISTRRSGRFQLRFPRSNNNKTRKPRRPMYLLALLPIANPVFYKSRNWYIFGVGIWSLCFGRGLSCMLRKFLVRPAWFIYILEQPIHGLLWTTWAISFQLAILPPFYFLLMEVTFQSFGVKWWLWTKEHLLGSIIFPWDPIYNMPLQPFQVYCLSVLDKLTKAMFLEYVFLI